MSIRSLSFAQNKSAMNRPNQPHISASRPSVSEIDALLSMEQQKHNALNHIRDEIIRLNREQALFQQNSQRTANVSKGADEAVSSTAITRTEENKTAFGVSGRRQKRHRVSRFSSSHEIFKPIPTFNLHLSCRAILVVRCAIAGTHQNGAVAPTVPELYVTRVVTLC